jgi:SAM-dependent methyltransferase
MADTSKPYAEACDRNRDPILRVLRAHLDARSHVLEVGSGTGQHAVYFTEHLTEIVWQTADLPENHAGIAAWIDDARSANLRPPVVLDLAERGWAESLRAKLPVGEVHAGADGLDAVFTANTMHIVSWSNVVSLLSGAARLLRPDGLLIAYGPFAYGGRHTSASNAAFDAMLRARDPDSGIRDFEAVDAIAYLHGLRLAADHAMPANNRTLVWRRAA